MATVNQSDINVDECKMAKFTVGVEYKFAHPDLVKIQHSSTGTGTLSKRITLQVHLLEARYLLWHEE